MNASIKGLFNDFTWSVGRGGIDLSLAQEYGLRVVVPIFPHFFCSFWPLRLILLCYRTVQNVPSLTVRARLDRSVKSALLATGIKKTKKKLSHGIFSSQDTFLR